MSSYTVWKCDRCGAESKDIAFTQRLTLDLPTGHSSRTDAFDDRTVELCRECHMEFNRWWKREVEIVALKMEGETVCDR